MLAGFGRRQGIEDERMKIPTTILTVLTLLGAIATPTARAETMAEVVLIGRGDLLSLNVPASQQLSPPRRVTRIERYAQPAPLALSDPALAALDDQQVPLLEAIASSQPVLEHLVVPSKKMGARQTVLGGLPEDMEPYATEELPTSLITSEVPFESVISTTVSIGLLLLTTLSLRRWILAAVSRAVLWLVIVVNHRGATIVSSPQRKRRRRSSSRRRTPDVSWYFRQTAKSSGSRGRSRRRWSTNSRPREYVVTDVVYASSPQQPTPRYLLTNSLN